MGAGREAPPVGEIHVLSDQEPALTLRGEPYRTVISARQTFLRHGADLVTQLGEGWAEPGGQVLVELDVHDFPGISGSGMSSCADAAAKAMAPERHPLSA